MREDKTHLLDDKDRALINGYQGGFPLCENPFAEVGKVVGISEEECISRISRLLDEGILTLRRWPHPGSHENPAGRF